MELDLLFLEDFLFFPVVVLLSLILIVLSFRLILRVIIFCMIVFSIWFGLYKLGLVPSPLEIYNVYFHPHKEQSKIAFIETKSQKDLP